MRECYFRSICSRGLVRQNANLVAMTELIQFYFLRGYEGVGSVSNCLPNDVFDECVQRWPRFKKKGNASFDVEIEADSALAREIMEFIRAQTGKTPNWKRFPAVYDENDRYQLFGKRIFSEEEISAAKYLWCIPKKQITKSAYRRDDGIIEIKRDSILSQPIGTTPSGFSVLCTEKLKNEIEAENFLNARFVPVEVTGKKPAVEYLWEIRGERTLPPLQNVLVNDQGKEPDDSARGCWVDDLFFPPILKYSLEILKEIIGEFDIADTNERWHSGILARRSPFLICSNRFRLWCQSHALKFDWAPVRLKTE